jgi:hypothetical protein
VGRRGDGYGSEDHLRRYLALKRGVLDEAVCAAVECPRTTVGWLDFPVTKRGDREFRGLEFLLDTPDAHVLPAWRDFWPTRGRAQTWDAIGRCDCGWLLVEAKANWPEFVTSPCGATGLSTIRRALSRVKRDLGAHHHFDWTSLYYQHANRLAALWFLQQHCVSAHLIGIYFFGDSFPDGRPCPATEREWRKLIEARRLTLGLRRRHALSPREHHVFLPAFDR